MRDGTQHSIPCGITGHSWVKLCFCQLLVTALLFENLLLLLFRAKLLPLRSQIIIWAYQLWLWQRTLPLIQVFRTMIICSYKPELDWRDSSIHGNISRGSSILFSEPHWVYRVYKLSFVVDRFVNLTSSFVWFLGSNTSRDSTGSLSTSYEMEKYLSTLSSLTPAGKSGSNKHGSSAGGGMSNTLSTTLTPSSSYEIQRVSPSRTGTSRILGGIFDSKRASRFIGGAAASDSREGMSHFTMAHTGSGLTFSAKSPRGNSIHRH